MSGTGGVGPQGAVTLNYDRKAEIELFRSLCRNSFWAFLKYAFGVQAFMRANPEKNWLTDRVHRPLVNWLDLNIHDWLRTRHLRETPLKLMIVWPRGFGKTTIVTKACQLWVHLLNPDLSTITDSVTTEKSWDFLKSLKDVMEGNDSNAWFSSLYGNWRDPKRAWKQGHLNHAFRKSVSAEAASMVCSSVEKGITGKHPDALFIDDPIVQEKLVEGFNWIDKVNRHMDAMIPALSKSGLLVATATRYHDSDWLGKYMRDEGVRAVHGHEVPYRDFDIRPDGQWELYYLQARDANGDPVLPEVVGDKWLTDYENKNAMDFQAQMMNNPGEGSHMPLKQSDIEKMWVQPHEVPRNLRVSIHCDTAWKDPKTLGKGDFSVIQAWGHSQDGSGRVYFLEGRRSNRWTSEEFFDQLIMMCQKLRRWLGEKPFYITDEQAIGGKHNAFEGLVWNHFAQAGMVAPPVLLINRMGKKKEIRIREAAGYWKNQKVRLVRNAPNVESLVSEMLRIGVSAHDDMADAAADVFHPEIYMEESVFGNSPQPEPPRRPMDDYLQLPLSQIDEMGVREIYDAAREEEDRRLYWAETWGEA